MAYLGEQGADGSLISTEELDHLDSEDPVIVILGKDTEKVWEGLSASELSQRFENHKVIGMGGGGTALFFLLGLKLGGGAGGQDTRVVVEYPELLPNSDKLVDVYHPGEAYVVGAYDYAFSKEQGHPADPGFEGIAHWEDYTHHWPIARQGSCVLWGFEAPTDQMTDIGKALFMNLLVYLQANPPCPYRRRESSANTSNPV